MKKLLTILALAVCCAMATTSCDKPAGNSDEWVYYNVNPNGEFSRSNALAICAKMRTAMEDANLTNDVGLARRNDAKAIHICDAVYEDTKNQATASFSLALNVQDTNGKTTNLKIYNYNQPTGL